LRSHNSSATCSSRARMQDWPAPKLKGRNLDAGMRCRWIRRPTSGKAGERSDGAQSGEGVRRVTPHDIESCTTRLVDPLPKAPAIAMMKDLENDPGWIVQTRGSNPLRRLHPVNPIDPGYPASSLGSLRCTHMSYSSATTRTRVFSPVWVNALISPVLISTMYRQLAWMGAVIKPMQLLNTIHAMAGGE
jgi:hypothetical protein